MSEGISRLLAGITAIGIWYVSYVFSVDGFGMLSPHQEYLWIGKFLAFAITAYELIWNGMKTRDNETMYWVGLGCYIYGIGTNILGVSKWLGLTKGFIMSTDTGDPWTIVTVALYVALTIALAFMFEAAPEPTLIYAFTGKFTGGDFLGNLMGTRKHVTSASRPTQVASPISGVIPQNQNRQQNTQKPQDKNTQTKFQPMFGRPDETGMHKREDQDSRFKNLYKD